MNDELMKKHQDNEETNKINTNFMIEIGKKDERIKELENINEELINKKELILPDETNKHSLHEIDQKLSNIERKFFNNLNEKKEDMVERIDLIFNYLNIVEEKLQNFEVQTEKKTENIIERVNNILENVHEPVKDNEHENIIQENNELKEKIKSDEENIKKLKEELESTKRGTTVKRDLNGYYAAVLVAIIAVLIILFK